MGEEIKLVSLVLQVQVVCDRMEGWGEEKELQTFARLPNDKYPYRLTLFFVVLIFPLGSFHAFKQSKYVQNSHAD